MSVRGEFYPSWRYHATDAPKLVKNAEEDAALGEGWYHPSERQVEAEPEQDGDVVDAPKRRGRKPKA